MSAVESPWREAGFDRPGAGLLFGRMFEDWRIEAGVFAPRARVFCIASAGCTALALAARGHDVTAVDINPAQVALVRARASGGESQEGAVDRMLARGRRAMRFVGWTEATLRAFLALHDPIEQRTFWRTRLDTWRWRTALGALLSPLTLRRFYPAPLLRAVPDGFARIVRRRLERGFSTHPNCTNPYARWLLLGEPVPAPQPGPAATLTVVHADAVEFLESCPPASFGAFTLSNIADGAGESVAARLRAAAGRAAEPGAVIVERSFAEPQNPDEELWAARDRALIWGRIHVETKI